jgi:hypothetical protein
VIPDVTKAVASPQRVSADTDRSQQVLELVSAFPTVTWGRDGYEPGTCGTPTR